MKVYYLEDDVWFKESLERTLKRKGFTFTENVEDKDIDIFLIDVLLWGGKTSYKFTKELREKTNKPIILFSSHICRDKLKQFQNIPVNEYINKWEPINVIVMRLEMNYNMYKLYYSDS